MAHGPIPSIMTAQATVAQLAEQRFCKPQVVGSSPTGGFLIVSTLLNRSIVSCGILLSTIYLTTGCGEAGSAHAQRYNDPLVIERLLTIEDGSPKQALYDKVHQGPLHVLLRVDVTRRAAKDGVAATSAGDEQWFYAASDDAFYIVEMEGEEILWVSGPIDGDVHAFISNGW